MPFMPPAKTFFKATAVVLAGVVLGLMATRCHNSGSWETGNGRKQALGATQPAGPRSSVPRRSLGAAGMLGSSDVRGEQDAARPARMATAASSDALESDADKQDRVDAYHRAVRCHEYVQARRAAARIIQQADTGNAENAEAVARKLASLSKVMQSRRGSCEGTNLEAIDDELFQRALLAGRIGHPAAQACFVSLGSRFQNSKSAQSEQRQLYLAAAPRFIDQALQTGYWPVLQFAVMRLVGWSVDSGTWEQIVLPRPAPYRLYRALRLAYYRSSPAHIESVESMTATLEQRFRFTPDQINQADRWAMGMYQEKFADQSPIDIGDGEACQ